MNNCGKSHFERTKKSKSLYKGLLAVLVPLVNESELTDVELYSSYLGKVTVKAKVVGDNAYLESIYTTIKNRKVYIKVLDQTENKLSENYIYSPQQLLHLNGVCINKTENLYNYLITLHCYLLINRLEFNKDNIDKYESIINELITPELTDRLLLDHPELLSTELKMPLSVVKKILQKVTLYNSRVDILFTAIQYLEFISYVTNGQIDTINNQDILVFVSGVPNLDNAYWNGYYMVFGNGDTMFYPLTSVDVIGHELTHGLVQGICDLEYKGHSGALNESYADIFGTMLEFYVHDKYGSLILGKSNWLIGDELTMSGYGLRNMGDPHACQQPKKLFDKYYINPNSMIDYGGVHINSGIPNYCFYLISQQSDKIEMLRTFLDCLYKLYKRSDFYTFSSTLAQTTYERNDTDTLKIVNNSLITVGLPPRSYSTGKYSSPRYFEGETKMDSFYKHIRYGEERNDITREFLIPYREKDQRHYSIYEEDD